MKRTPARLPLRDVILICLTVACCPATAWADETIGQANNVEALTMAVSRQTADLQSTDKAGAQVFNRTDGPQIAFGYANTRTRAVFGVPGFYTRFEVELGWSRQDFAGNSTNPSTGAVVLSNGPFESESAAIRGRIGYAWEFGPGGRAALTPYAGIAGQAWLRGSTAISGTTSYMQDMGEIGLLAQAALSPRFVLGADASVGNLLGAWQIDARNLIAPSGRIASRFAITLDHRSGADSHERIVLQHSFAEFGAPAQSTGSLEPRRNSAFTIGLEFGTAGRLLEELFY